MEGFIFNKVRSEEMFDRKVDLISFLEKHEIKIKDFDETDYNHLLKVLENLPKKNKEIYYEINKCRCSIKEVNSSYDEKTFDFKIYYDDIVVAKNFTTTQAIHTAILFFIQWFELEE